MKATRKDFFREIKQSSGRFWSILFIVALGVAFFSGIRASEPDMRLTGDAYFDGANLMDVKVVSTLGLTDEDIEAFAELSLIEQAEGAYSTDVLTDTGENSVALHVISLSETMNTVSVTEGRLPENAGECLADDEMEYAIGDQIVVTSGTDDPLSDTLTTDTFTVVGIGSSPCYISFNRGSTTIGNGSVEGFLYVPAQSFCLDVYTECDMLVAGARELTAYTDAYDDRIDDAMDQVQELTGERGIIRRRELVDEATVDLDEAKADLDKEKKRVNRELQDAEQEIADGEEELADAEQQLADGQTQLADAKATLNQKQKDLDSAKAEYEAGQKEWEKGKKEYEKAQAEFEKSEPDAKKQIEEGKAGLAQIKAALDEAKAAYDPIVEAGLEAQYVELGQTVATLQEQYDATDKKIKDAQKELSSARKQLKATKKQLDASEAELAAALEKIQQGQQQIDDGWTELASKEAELEEAQTSIEEHTADLQEAKKELEKEKKKAQKEIKKAESKIEDAQAEIEDIPEATWYVYDRSTLPEYSGYGENADRMRAIGRVFPVLFFFVAALISLTGMTRMVEEQRVQIGTMKALGYRKSTIAGKYMGYAFGATVVGSILGVLVGEKILPYIIIYAYGIMYHHMSKILVPYVLSYGVLASGAAILCTMAATLISCYSHLQAQAAALMRPPAPKGGKRVLLERIPFVWKRLNFSWKSTVRNLLRYKKRFFMTVFGIGGCMALMVVGYGIRDSVYEIAEVQYSRIQTYDGQIVLQDDLTAEERQDLDRFLTQDGDIDRYMNAYMKNITLAKGKKTRQTYITVLWDLDHVAEFVDFHDRKTAESYTLDDDGVIISEKTARLLDAQVGDVLTVQNEDEGDREVRISQICENYMGHYIYMTPSYYEKTFGEEPEYNCVWFATDASYDGAQKEKAGEQIMTRDEVLSITYMHDIKKQLDDMLSSLNLVIIVLIISAGMLAFVVLYNLNTINITERQRELATLKVLGFYDPEVAIYVFRENVLLTFIGAVVGVGLGKVLHRFIIETVEVDAVMFGRVVKLPSYVYSLLFTVGFSLLINAIMYFKLKKIDMVESLKSME